MLVTSNEIILIMLFRSCYLGTYLPTHLPPPFSGNIPVTNCGDAINILPVLDRDEECDVPRGSLCNP